MGNRKAVSEYNISKSEIEYYKHETIQTIFKHGVYDGWNLKEEEVNFG